MASNGMHAPPSLPARAARTACALLALLLLATSAALAQDWRARVGVGGAGASAYSVAELPDGGVIVGASESSLGWLFELGPARDLRWQARLQDADGTLGVAAVVALPDGSVILAGSMRESASSTASDGALVRLDPTRRIAWAVTYGGTGSSESFSDIVLRSDGTLAVIGNAGGSGLVIVARQDGTLSSQVRWTASAPDSLALYRLATIGTSDVVIVGTLWFTLPSGQQDFDALVARASPSFGPSWQVALGAYALQETQPRVAVLTGGDVVATMLTEQPPAEATHPKACVTRMSPNSGAIRWCRCLDQQVYFSSGVAPSRDGGVVVGGDTYLTGQGRDEAYAFRLDATGATQAQLYFGTDLSDQRIAALRPRPGGGYIAVGEDEPLALVMTLPDSLTPAAECGIPNESGAGIVPGPTATRTPDVTTSNPGFAFVPRALEVVPTTLGLDPPCGAPTPPLEVSPRGSATPLQWMSKTHLAWDEAAASLSDTFDVHRGRLGSLRAGDYGACLATSLVLPDLDDSELPGADAFFYLVRGRNTAGYGTLGFRSDDVERITPTPCP